MASIVAITVGVVGVMLAFYQTYVQAPRAMPRYEILASRSQPVAESSPPGTGEKTPVGPVCNNCVTELAFWNDGSGPIRNVDNPQGNPVRIKLGEGFQFLGAEVIRESDPGNRFRLSPGKSVSEKLVEFDYVDRKQGAVLKLVHTGPSDRAIRVEGAIIGSVGILRASETVKFSILAGFLWPIFVVFMLGLLTVVNLLPKPISEVGSVIIWALFALLVGFFVFAWMYSRLYHPVPLHLRASSASDS